MITTYRYEPLNFFLLVFMMSWAMFAGAIYVSWQPSLQHFLLPLILGGISCPAVSTLIMLIKSKNKNLWYDFFQRLRPDRIIGRFIPVLLFLFPCQILLAITLSLFFGQSIDQFAFTTHPADQALEGINILTILFVVFLVGPFEEIGWRGYGIDSLNSKFNLIKTSLIFGAIWGLWHLPLFFVKNGAFQQQIWAFGLLHTCIYFIDLFLITIITNWLYVKNNRNIFIAILFHSMYDICISIFHITPFTWFLLTLILLLTSIIILKLDKEIFFKNPKNVPQLFVGE